MLDHAKTSTKQMIAALWARNQPQILERLAVLDKAAADGNRGLLEAQQQAEAAEIAHKLAGSLGMFGFHEGTRIARELEQRLEATTVDPLLLATLSAELREALFPVNAHP